MLWTLALTVRIDPVIHCSYKFPYTGECLCPLRLHPCPRSTSVKKGLPDVGGSKGGWRLPLPFTPKFLARSLQPLKFPLTSVSLPPSAGLQALGLSCPLVLPVSRSWLWLAGGWGAMTPRLGARERRGCSPRGCPALPVLLLVGFAPVKRPFSGPNLGFSLMG